MTDAPTTPDPIEIAMEAEAEGRAPSGVATQVLIEQLQLIRTQTRLGRWQIASERAGFALKVLTGAAGLAAASALGLMVWQAAHADGVLLEPFTVPPAMAADGVSGELVASHVLDELTRMREQTFAPGEVRDYADDWGRSIKVAIPGSGISLGELQEALRQWLGRQTRITGEVYRTPLPVAARPGAPLASQATPSGGGLGGLAIRAKVPGRPGLKVEGPATGLEASAQGLARLIYRETQPVRYATWLQQHEQLDEAVAAARTVAEREGPVSERAQAFLVWSKTLVLKGDSIAAAAMARRAAALDPGRSDAWFAIAIPESNLGHNEASAAAWREFIKRRPNDRRVSPAWRDIHFPKAQLASVTADFAETVAQYRAAAASPTVVRSQGVLIDGQLASGLARLHDVAGARALIAAPRFSQPDQAVDIRYQMLQSTILTAYYAEDWTETARSGAEFLALPSRYMDHGHATPVAMLGLARAHLGDAAGARAVVASLAPDCDGCMWIAGRTLAVLGDRAGAERTFAMVAARTPTLPQPHYWWGRTRLEMGDARGALPLLAESTRRQPKWADPLEAQGEALAALGRWNEADQAFAKAAPLALKWGRLQLKWAEVSARLGKRAQANAKFRAAGGLYLTPAERAELQQVNR